MKLPINIRVLDLFFIFIATFYAHILPGLVSGTKITTVNGFIPIENLAAGNKISSYNSKESSFPEVTIEKVCIEDVENLYVITTDNSVIYTSGDQLFYEITSGDFIKAENLKCGSILQTKNFEKCLCISIEKKNTLTRVYDIILQGPHLFFSSDAQVLTHNYAALILCNPLIAEAIVALAGFCVGVVCLYDDKPTGNLSKLDKIAEKVKNDITDFGSKYYTESKYFSLREFPENHKNNAPTLCKQPSLGGVMLDSTMYQEMCIFPFRYSALYPIALMTGSGDVACVIFCSRFSHRKNEIQAIFTFEEFGREIFSRTHPFVTEFFAAEDKIQLDNLRIAVQKWPSALISKLFKSDVTAKERKNLRTQYSKLDQVIYGNTFGIDAIYHMAEKSLAPSLVLQTIKYGRKGVIPNPERLIYFDSKQDIAVLVEKASKKIINVGRYSSDLCNLNEATEEEEAKEKEKEEAKDKTDEAVDKALKGTKKGEEKRCAKQFDKVGGFDEALKDFENMDATGVKDVSKDGKIVKVGTLPDGRRVNVRNDSSDGRPTLEIYDTKTEKA